MCDYNTVLYFIYALAVGANDGPCSEDYQLVEQILEVYLAMRPPEEESASLVVSDPDNPFEIIIRAQEARIISREN